MPTGMAIYDGSEARILGAIPWITYEGIDYVFSQNKKISSLLANQKVKILPYQGEGGDTISESILYKNICLTYNIKDVCLVSSDYHIDRIRMISKKVFDPYNIRVTFVSLSLEKPSKYEQIYYFNNWLALSLFKP